MRPRAQVGDVIDWQYYRNRLEDVIRKIVTIPAALQGVTNPVPRVAHPEWLRKFVAARDDTRKQTSITSFFGREPNFTVPSRCIFFVRSVEGACS